MTKRRAALTFGQAITVVAGRIGWTECARIVERTERTVRYWSEDDVPGSPTIEQARDLDAAYRAAGGEGFPILESYALQLEVEMVNALADQAGLATDIAAVAVESSEAIAFSIAVTQPGAPATAVHRAIAETEEAAVANTRLLGRLKSFLPNSGVPAARTGG